jgi:predicted permease
MRMFRTLTLRLRALLSPRRAERDLHDELSFHVEREAKKLIDQGVPAVEARYRARARFGAATVVADECRDQRGTAFVDNTLRDIVYALRAFVRAPLVSVTIVLTLAIGLGLIGVLFTVLNVMLFRVDNVPDINEMFAVERPRNERDERQPFTKPQFEAMRRETRVFSGIYAAIADIESRIDGRVFSGSAVTGNFFQVLGVQAAMGRTLLPADDEPGESHPVIVLSHNGWTRKLNADPRIVGRQLIINGAPHEIIGVMPEGFRGLEVSSGDYWAPLSMLAAHSPSDRGREDTVGIGIVGRLMPGTSPDNARAQLEAWYARQAAAGTERRTPSIELLPKRGTVPQPMEAVMLFTPLFFAFGLILMIGCANVANLLLARGLSRQKEIGIRLSLGASRARIIRQLLTESLMLSLTASVLGFFIARGALGAIIAAVMRSMPVDLGDIVLAIPGGDWRVALFLALSAVMATALFGLMPALQATSIDPMRTLRGEIVKDARPNRSRSVLIGLQVAASALLLICSAIFLRSSLASATVDSGLRTADTILIAVANEPKRQVVVETVKSDPSVVATAAIWPEMMAAPRAVTMQSQSQSQGSKMTVGYRLVSSDYFEILGIPLVDGRAFTAVEAADQLPVVIINESLAKTMFPGAAAVGQTIQLEPDLESPTRRQDEPPLMMRTATVVGVSRDVPGFRLSENKQADLFIPVHAGIAKTMLVARVHGDPDQVRRTLLDRLILVDPNMGQILTMRTIARMETYFLQIAFWTTVILGGLALSLTVSGLFSVLSYLVERRTKEIGVRMALGATSTNVIWFVIAQTSRPVIVGLAGGASLVLALATLLLSMPTAGLIGDVVHVLDPIAYASSIMLIAAACLLAASIPARRAARVDPMGSLRQE